MAIKEEIAATQEEKQLSLSDRAANELKGMLIENNKEGAALRVWVAGGGCSGLSYGMAIDDNEPEEGDVVLNDRGIKIVVDSLSLKYMAGSVIEFVDDTLGGGFKIENPKATKSCGCGSSFSTDEEGLEGLDTGKRGGCGGCGSH
ncbi:MAG: iron-sulfur cluster assembly accessory protein [Fimbriimonadaceae bacterium]